MIRYHSWILGSLLLAGTANAQPAQVQAIRSSEAEELNRNLARLASNPRDVNALIGAGEAALEMDDARAAAGFFARADAIQGNNGRVKAGLARVMLNNQNAAEALRLFDQATRLGYSENTLLSDRGLAHDMMGDQAAAQRDYQAALRRTPDDAELIRRYAASLGISGQVDAAEKALGPLLYKSDRAAWRYRAFIFAMNNRQQEARKVAQQTMPGPLASAIMPYMEKMPYLTASQKAAAVHFGHFPANVGTRIAAATATPTAPPIAERPPAQPSTALATRAQPAMPRAAAQGRPATQAATAAATQPLQPAITPRQPTPSAPKQSAAPLPRQVQGPPVDSAPEAAAAPAAPPKSSPSSTSQLNAISLAQASSPAAAPSSSPAPAAPAPATTMAPAPRQQPDPEATRTLADIIRAIDVPDSERQASVVPVDLAEVQALQEARRAERQAAADKAKKAATAKAKAEADAKAKKEAEAKAKLAANPPRNWLQIGTGQDRNALAFTLKAMRRKHDSLAPQDGWVASWGRTNRLLVGPFASFTRAKNLEAELKKAGADVFAWKSEAGEVVERVGAK